jgi:prepilin-type N-terminal cleavage/methylation domain-containing protein
MSARINEPAAALWRPPGRRRDAKVARDTKMTRQASRGFSLMELLVAMALFAVMAGTTWSALPRNPYGVWGAQTQIISEIRRVRNESLTRGEHFMLRIVDANSWESYRMEQDADGDWLIDGSAIRSGDLPEGTSFTTGIGSEFEFTTRGLMVTPDAAITILMTHSESGITKGITVWPSGQVSPS